MPFSTMTPLNIPQIQEPTVLEKVAAALSNQPNPQRQYEQDVINRQQQLQRMQVEQGQEARLTSKHRLDQFTSLATVARVLAPMSELMDDKTKAGIAQQLSQEAIQDDVPIKDPEFYKALMNNPSEMHTFLTRFNQGIAQNQSINEALQNSTSGLTDKNVLNTVEKIFTSQFAPQGGQFTRTQQDIMFNIYGTRDAKHLTPEQQTTIGLVRGLPSGAQSIAMNELMAKPLEQRTLEAGRAEEIRKQNQGEQVSITGQKAAATTTAQAIAKQGAPMAPKDLTQVVNIRGESPLNIAGQELSPNALRAGGFRYLPEDRMKSFQSGLIALTQIDRLAQTGRALFRGVEPGQNLGNALKLRGKQVLGDAGVRGFEALVLETLPSNAIASGLTPGRIGERLIETIEKPIMPNLSDTEASFDRKIAILKQRLKNNTEVHFGLGIKADLVSGASTAQTKEAAPTLPSTVTLGSGKRLAVPGGFK